MQVMSKEAQNLFTNIASGQLSIAELQRFVEEQRQLPEDKRAMKIEELHKLIDRVTNAVLSRPLFIAPEGMKHLGCLTFCKRVEGDRSKGMEMYREMTPRPQRSTSTLAAEVRVEVGGMVVPSSVQRSASSPS